MARVASSGCLFTLAYCAISALGAAAPAAAAETSLDGSWRGGGRVMLASGDQERATCRARFSPESSRTYRMQAVCATASARVSQTANLRRVSADSFSGRFYNQEYNVSGSIHITVHGNRMSASLNAEQGSAQLALSR